MLSILQSLLCSICNGGAREESWHDCAWEDARATLLDCTPMLKLRLS